MLLKIPLLEDVLTKTTHAKRHHLYDFVDRLHFYVTVGALAFFSVLVGTKQHFGHPIDCMIPADQDGVDAWRAYILDFCFMYGTYRYNLNTSSKGEFPMFVGYTPVASVNYYQWVPYFLAFQAFCFMLPHWFWSWVQSLLYLDMQVIVNEASNLNKLDKQKEINEKLDKIADFIRSYFQYRKLSGGGLFAKLLRHPSIASFFYVLTKLLFLANVAIQFVAVTNFLGFRDFFWGIEMIAKVLFTSRLSSPLMNKDAEEFTSFPYFPITVACDYEMFAIGNNIQHNSVQCIIPLNFINEKIFVALWIWLALLFFTTIINIFVLFFSIWWKRQREEFIFSLIREENELPKKRLGSAIYRAKHANFTQHRLNFVHSFMGADGVLLVQFMRAKAGTLRCREVLLKVWKQYAADHSFQTEVKPLPLGITSKGEMGDYSEFNFGTEDDSGEMNCKKF